MKPTTRSSNYNTVKTEVLYMALELSQREWRIAFGNGVTSREVAISAKDTVALKKEIGKAKEKLGLKPETKVLSCYEAGRDGFWIHRYLKSIGVHNEVVDSSSIEVDRRARRMKTDRLDARKLLQQLILHDCVGIRFRVVVVPSEEEEDRRRTHRELERLKKERMSHGNRIKSLMNLHGIVYKNRTKRMDWKHSIEHARDWRGKELLTHQKEELLREAKRLELVEEQIRTIEKSMAERVRQGEDESMQRINRLMQLKGLGIQGSWILILEWFGWKQFNNRREVGAAAGLVGTPYASGESQREQGITKAGNRRIRGLALELAWLWQRYQPDSELTQWFAKKFGGSQRSKKVGIVALARRLLIAIWRYITFGEIPRGAKLKVEVSKKASGATREELVRDEGISTAVGY